MKEEIKEIKRNKVKINKRKGKCMDIKNMELKIYIELKHT